MASEEIILATAAGGADGTTSGGSCGSQAQHDIPHEHDRQRRIREAAYYRAERRGFQPGFEMEDWIEAEREVQTQDGVQAAADPLSKLFGHGFVPRLFGKSRSEGRSEES